MPPLAVRSRLSRPFLALLAMLLVLPLSALLSAAPAQAAAFVADGTVSDALGDPLDAVTVEALASPAFTTVTASTTSDATGAYTLPLPQGTYHLRFTKAGYGSAFYGGSVASAVAMDGEGSLTVDGEPVLDNLLDDVSLTSTQTHDLTGLVKGTGGAGVDGVLVTAHPSGDPATAVDTATTAGGGAYALQLPAGLYNLEYADTGGTYLPAWYGGAEPGQEITVQSDGTLLAGGAETGCTSLCDVTLTLPAPDQTYPVRGTLTDANGDPIDGLAVHAVHTGGTPADQDADTTTGVDPESLEHGTYLLQLEAGTYEISFDGGTHFADATYEGAGGAPATITVSPASIEVDGEVVPGGVLDTIELAGLTDYGFSGEVTDGTTGLVGITVTVFREGDTSVQVATATSTAGGAYTVSGLKIGTYVVRFTDNVADGTDYVQTWLGGPPTGSPVKIGQGGVLTYAGGTVSTLPDVVMTVPPPDATYDVSGDVLDVLGAPIDGVGVHADPTGATPDDQAVDTTTGVDPDSGDHGRYHLMLEQGTYEITFDGGADFGDATYTGDGSGAATIAVDGTGVVRVNGTEAVGGVLDAVTLIGTTNYPVSGTVTNGSTALPGLTVAVFTEGETSGDPLVTTTTSGTGGYAFDLPVGSYSLRYSGSSGGSLYTTRWFGTGSLTGTPVQMGQGGVISVDGDPVSPLPDVVMTVAGAGDPHALPGDVVDNNFEGLPGVLVTAVAVSGGAVQDTDTSGSDGHFQLDLVPGTYQVKYEKSGYPLTWYPDPDTEGAHANIVVALDGTISVNGVALTEGLDAMVLLNPATKHPVSGTVVDELLAGLSGITVEALPEGESTVAATTTSTAGGAYTLQVPVGTYTIRFTDNVVASPTYAVTYLGGASPSSVKVATRGQVSVDDTNVATLPEVTMTEVADDVRYDLKGTVYNENYDPLNGATVEVIPVAGTDVANTEGGTTGPDPVTGAGTLGNAGVYRIPTKPGKYQLRFTKTGYQPTYLASFDDPTRPVTVTVSANGVISAPGLDIPGGVVDDVQLLLKAPVVVTAPKLTGKLVVGQVVTATPGTWSPAIPELYPDWQDSTYVEWFLDGKSADQFSSGYYSQKFKVPAVAATKKLSFKITIDDPEGLHASATYTSKPVAVPKAPSSLKATYKAGKLTVTLTVPTLKKPTGKITVLEGTRKIGGGTIVARNKGVIVITLAKLTKGKHKLTIKYAGTATIAKCKKVVTIRV